MSVHGPVDETSTTELQTDSADLDFGVAIPEPPDLFPLPLTPFEELMVQEEADGYPITFYLQLRLTGKIDNAAAAKAMRDALNRHPLLACRIQYRRGTPYWIWANQKTPLADTNVQRWQTAEPWKQRIDLTQSLGLRIWGEEQADASTIVFQFHHACCDGIGAAQFLEDFAVGYHFYFDPRNEATAAGPDYRPLDGQALRTRNSPEGRRVSNLPGSWLSRTWSIAKYSLRYLRRPKLSLAGQGDANPSEPSVVNLGLRIKRLSRRDTRSLRNAAKACNATVSDLMIRELLVVANHWHKATADKQDTPDKNAAISIQLPNSVRGPNDDRLPACNVIGNIFVERSPTEIEDEAPLLESVRDEMQFVHQSQAGWIFIQALTVLRRIPGVLKLIHLSSRHRCMSTIILSHMGNIMNSIGARLPKRDGEMLIGDATMTDVCGIAPLRPGTNVVVSTMILQGQLLVGMRCHPTQFSDDEASQLMNHFIERLQETAGGTSA